MPIRNLGFMSWKNDLAHLEKEKGSIWKKTIDSENAMFTEALNPLGFKIKAFKKLLKSKHTHPRVWKGWEIQASPFSPEQIWLFKETGFKCKAWDADVYDDYFAAAVQDSDGFERFTVRVYKAGKQIATLQTTGPQVAWLKGSLVYLGSSSDLRYDSACLWDPKTNESRVLYTTENPVENLELGRAEDGSVFVIRNDFVTKHLGFVNKGVEWVDKGSDIFVITRKSWIKNGHHRLFPSMTVEAMSIKSNWAITIDHGIRTIIQLGTVPMVVIWGEISFDSRQPDILHVADMRYEPYVIKTDSWSLSTPDAYEFPCSYYNDVAPTFVIRPKSKHIKGLLITAYGAYGTPTKIGSLIPKWRPLLENGWTIASVCVPGSGDDDLAWKKAGQRQNRGEAIRLFSETIQRLQEELGISPSHTALYGRSAGGLLVISAAVLHPGLVGALYVESPYVDVLRTISNPELPLTLLETKEFGIGSNPTNMIATGAWSPMEHIPAKGYPDIFVVARSDMADLEVYPYEVVKWIIRMRGNHSGKFLYIDNGKGHFTTNIESRAEDLALLDSWLETSFARKKNRRYKYNIMANGMSRKNRKNMTRKNRKDRKNRKNVTGGKRRVGRKSHTRKH